MAVDALDVVALGAALARRFPRDDAEVVHVPRGEVKVVGVRTLVDFAGVVVTTPLTDVVLVAALELLEALHLLTVILQCNIETLAFLVARDGGGEPRVLRCRTRQVGER